MEDWEMPDKSFKDYVLDQLELAGGATCRAMFGGHGLYRGGRFFGIIHRGRLYFKIDEASLPDYRAQGMECFRPNERQKLTSFYEVPADVLENQSQLVEWAARAVSAAATS
jgi:DNA transformation protein